MIQHIIKDIEFVECPYCEKGPNNRYKLLHWKHLRIHNKTLEDVIREFPDLPTITLVESEKRERIREQPREDKKQKEFTNTKRVNCCICGGEYEVNINISNKYFVCPSCKEKGHKSPISKKVYEKQKEGMLKKYGVSNPSNLNQVVEKRKQIVEEKKRNDPNYFDEIQEKREKTMSNKFGDNWTKKVNEISKEEMLEKYGVEHALQKDEFKEKAKDTYKERTGYDNAMHNPEIVEKMRENNIKKFGVDNPMKREDIKDKVVKTNVERYGVKYPTQSQEIKDKLKEKQTKSFLNRLDKLLDLYKLEILDSYKDAYTKYQFKCKVCGNIFTQNWNSIQQGYKCPICYPRIQGKKSHGQEEVETFISNLGIEFKSNERELIQPQELDILIPEHRIAIEYCGLYFHNYHILQETRPNIKDIKLYHYNKWRDCKNKGYQLITIFEDEWLFKNKIVKERLKYLLKISDATKVNARECIVEEIDPTTKNDFLDEFHIQGKDSSNIKLGAFFNDELVSVMTFSHGSRSKGIIQIDESVWELSRFCTNYNYNVRGISSKLLECFKRNYKWEEIFSYADLRWSNGNVYRQLGFQTNEKSLLNYWYIDVNKIKRIHRYELRKRPDEPKDITEVELRINEGYLIIWDCGNLKFVLNNPTIVKKSREEENSEEDVKIEIPKIKRQYQKENVQERRNRTSTKRYGGIGFQSKELRDKAKSSMKEKYGDTNIMKTSEGKEIFKKSMVDKYGVDNPMKIPEIGKRALEKLKGQESKLKNRTYEDIHGTEKAEDIKKKKSYILRERFKEKDIPKTLDPRGWEFLDDEYFGREFEHRYRCKKCGTEFKCTWEDIKHGFTCPGCFPRI